MDAVSDLFPYLWIYLIVILPRESAVMTLVGGQVLSINFGRYLFLKIHVEVCVSIHKKIILPIIIHRPQDCEHADLPCISIDTNMVSEMLNHILKHNLSPQDRFRCTVFLMLFHLA